MVITSVTVPGGAVVANAFNGAAMNISATALMPLEPSFSNYCTPPLRRIFEAVEHIFMNFY
jgi:hypothetical protein